MHKQDNTNRDPGLDAIMESMYKAAAKEPLNDEAKECPECGKVHPINASCGGAHEANSLDDWNDKMNKDDDQYNTSNQVHPDLDDAANGSLIEWINTQADGENGEAFVANLIQFIKDTEGVDDDDTGRVPSAQDYNDIARGRSTSWSQGKNI